MNAPACIALETWHGYNALGWHPFVSQQPLGLDVICSQGALTWAAQPYGIDSDVQEFTQVAMQPAHGWKNAMQLCAQHSNTGNTVAHSDFLQ